jgi:autotransporter-associated beta strand protein
MRKQISTFAILALLLTALPSICQAQLVEVPWIGSSGTKNWHDTLNWQGGTIPNDNLKVAKISGPLASGLNIDLGATDTTMARLILGSTTGAVTTNINSTAGGRLLFHNADANVTTAGNDADFDNNTKVNGRDFLIWQRGAGTTGENLNSSGDANADNAVDGLDLAIWQDQYGLGAGIFTAGVAGIESTGAAGASNVINAPIHLAHRRLQVGGSSDLTINGAITFEGDVNNTNISDAGIASLTLGSKVIINSPINIIDTDAGEAVDLYINDDTGAQGTMVIMNGFTGGGGILLGKTDNSLGLGRIELKTASTFTGSVRMGRGDLVVQDNNAFGTGTLRHEGPSNQFGYNLISDNDSRVIPNSFVFAQSQTVKGDHSLEFSGEITQTNNRGIINLLPDGKTVTFSGRLNIWEELETPEEIERRFYVDGTGRTIVNGTIHNDPIDAAPTNPGLRQITKSGTGSLLIDMAAGENNHDGPETVIMGNYHYATNGALNSHVNARIVARGGAIGVDQHPVAQNISTNTAFLNQIDPVSVGGLMLAPSDAAVNLNFTTGSLVNAANMTVAAPETNLTYTGTITPANDTYKLGGGSGILTLPTAQLTGARSLQVRNGGTVRLLGDNSYTGPTSILTKYTSSFQEQAVVNEASDAPGIFYDRLVAPVLEVDDLANGGVASSIGAASNAATNLKIQGSTLRYVGTGDSTDRLFTLGTGGGRLDSSGTGAVVFSNSGALGVPDAADITGTLDDYTGNPTEIINASSTEDVIIGMPVSDPDAGGPAAFGCGGGTTQNCIPAGTTVTGVSNDGKTIGLSASFGFNWKMNTRIVFGAVPRTLTLSGSNAGANALGATIANSAKGGVVNITKEGTGTWLLNGVSTSTGVTTVNAGTLGGDGGVGGNLVVNNGGTFAPGGLNTVGDFSVAGSFTLNGSGILGIQLAGNSPAQIDLLNVTGAATLSGVVNVSLLSFSPALNSTYTVLTAAGGITDSGLTLTGAAGFQKQIVGNSLVLKYVGGALSGLAAVPEPSSMVLIGLAMVCLGSRRQARS